MANKRDKITLERQDIKDMLQLLNDIVNTKSASSYAYRFKDTYAICSFLDGKLKETEDKQ